MANHFSAIKRTRSTERRTAINRMRKSRMRHAIRSMRRLLEKKEKAAAEKLMPQTFSIIDRAAKCGVIKGNTASRHKSRLSRRLRSLSA